MNKVSNSPIPVNIYFHETPLERELCDNKYTTRVQARVTIPGERKRPTASRRSSPSSMAMMMMMTTTQSGNHGRVQLLPRPGRGGDPTFSSSAAMTRPAAKQGQESTIGYAADITLSKNLRILQSLSSRSIAPVY